MPWGWSAIVLWVGMVILALGGIRAQRKTAQDVRPHLRTGFPLAILSGLSLPGLFVLFPLFLLTDRRALARIRPLIADLGCCGLARQLPVSALCRIAPFRS